MSVHGWLDNHFSEPIQPTEGEHGLLVDSEPGFLSFPFSTFILPEAATYTGPEKQTIFQF